MSVGQLEVNCFVLACEETREGVVVDPGDNAPGILELIAEDDIRVVEVVATHGHFDHIGRARSLMQETGAGFAVHPEDRSIVERMEAMAGYFGLETDPAPQIDRLLEEGDSVRFGKEAMRVLHTPGHSPGSVSFTWPGQAIVGDTVFMGSIGRTDFEGGSYETLMGTIRDRLIPLGDETEIHPGHGPSTTIGAERRTNPFLQDLG
jgi:glyoxylase-like metal-dependent hydrolase (beta-lactamase superfamily II)